MVLVPVVPAAEAGEQKDPAQCGWLRLPLHPNDGSHFGGGPDRMRMVPIDRNWTVLYT